MKQCELKNDFFFRRKSLKNQFFFKKHILNCKSNFLWKKIKNNFKRGSANLTYTGTFLKYLILVTP